MDPGPHQHMPHPFARAPHSSSSGGVGNSTSTSSRRGGDIAQTATPHHFQGPPPPGWIESHASSRGQEQRSTQPNPLRRSPRGSPATFRFENSYPPPTHHSVHARHLSGGGGSGGGGGGGPPPGHHGGGGLSSHHQQRGVPSPRGGPVGTGRGPPPPMRPLPPNGSSGSGPRRRPEHLMIGPLGDPMFGGSMGLGGGEANLGMETVSRVLIPNCKIGAVIGKGGAIIKHIREVRGGVRAFAQLWPISTWLVW